MDKMVCEFCGKVKDQVIFAIGASNQPDWCMVEGTGKMACPSCYSKAMKEGQAVIKGLVKPICFHCKEPIEDDSYIDDSMGYTAHHSCENQFVMEYNQVLKNAMIQRLKEADRLRRDNEESEERAYKEYIKRCAL